MTLIRGVIIGVIQEYELYYDEVTLGNRTFNVPIMHMRYEGDDLDDCVAFAYIGDGELIEVDYDGDAWAFGQGWPSDGSFGFQYANLVAHAYLSAMTFLKECVKHEQSTNKAGD